MSPNVGNFVHDLVEMAKAMETLPQVEAERDRLNGDLNQARQTIQSREERIISLKAEVESLQAEVRQTEAERDDAEIRFLELDEKAHRALSSLSMVAGYIEAAEQQLTPPKPLPMPEPVANPEPVYTASGWNENVQPLPEAQPQGQGESHPTAPATDTNTSTSMAGSGAEQSSSGQGESNPTASSEVGSQNAYGSTEHTVAPTTSEPAKPSGPYSGLRYHDHPTYVPYSQWIAGGGSEEDYHWRPSTSF